MVSNGSHNLNEALLALKDISEQHPIWQNALLHACQAGDLSKNDLKLLFEQYYLYSKNFTRLLALAMVKCDDDKYRSMLSENLWEEAGEKDLQDRHAEIYRRFLVSVFNMDLNGIQYDDYALNFYKSFFSLCDRSEADECAAILAFGTEGIVARLYAIFRNALLALGVDNTALRFFNLHMACDDMHAETLKDMVASYAHQPGWFDRCAAAIQKSLDLRDRFFTAAHEKMGLRGILTLSNGIMNKSNVGDAAQTINQTSIHINIRDISDTLYENKDVNNGIDFTVSKLPFASDVLDPRLVDIPPGAHNESHQHAHETIIFIMSGQGQMVMQGKSFAVEKGSVVHVPRWVSHQTRNTGGVTLRFFAVTDFGLTKHLPGNTALSYRAKHTSEEELATE